MDCPSQKAVALPWRLKNSIIVVLDCCKGQRGTQPRQLRSSGQRTFADQASAFIKDTLPNGAAAANRDPRSSFVFLAAPFHAAGDETKPHPALQILGRDAKP